MNRVVREFPLSAKSDFLLPVFLPSKQQRIAIFAPMKKFSLWVLSLCFLQASAQQDSLTIRNIFTEALTNGQSYENLRFLCKKIGGRLSGSPQAAAAVEYTRQIMADMNLDTVYLQECMVPRWVRGKEAGSILSTYGKYDVHLSALGGSVGTAKEGVVAKVIEVKSIEELDKLGAKLKGNIVFFNRAFPDELVSPFHAYGRCVDQRWAGPSAAAKHGAVGTIVRSMTNTHDDEPHTGSMRYDEKYSQIPCVAIAAGDADKLSELMKMDKELKFWLTLSCTTKTDVKSYNVIGELKGAEKPEEIIAFGGHLDSWDNGEGAHDDGAGCVQSIEVLRILKSIGYKPKRTLRAVMFMNEENGLRGGKKYAEEAKAKNERHIAAIESDAGGFSPRGFGLDMPEEKKQIVRTWIPLLQPYGLYDFTGNYGGADINPLKEQNTACFGLSPDPQRYFDYHHTAADVFEAINKRELEMGGAAMAALVYLLSEHGL